MCGSGALEHHEVEPGEVAAPTLSDFLFMGSGSTKKQNKNKNKKKNKKDQTSENIFTE